MKKVLLTGGHAATTGLAVIQQLRKNVDDLKIYWIGVETATSDSVHKSFEQKVYSENDVIFYPIKNGKLQTKFTKYTIPLLLKVPVSFLEAFRLVKKIKPDVILSFGGSVSLPVVFSGFLFRIPIIIHEQTAVAGRANIYSSKFAKIVAVSRKTSFKYFNKSNVVLTGNPLISEIEPYLKNKPHVRVNNILITGGSRGSVALNNALIPIIPALLSKYSINIQVGEANIDNFKYSHPNLTVFGQVTPEKMLQIINSSDIVISRAGANTVATLIAPHKPSLLVPIPWSYLNEQVENANYLKSFGLGRILNQSDLNPDRLLAETKRLIRDYPEIIRNSELVKSQDLFAAEKVSRLVEKYL